MTNKFKLLINYLVLLISIPAFLILVYFTIYTVFVPTILFITSRGENAFGYDLFGIMFFAIPNLIILILKLAITKSKIYLRDIGIFFLTHFLLFQTLFIVSPILNQYYTSSQTLAFRLVSKSSSIITIIGFISVFIFYVYHLYDLGSTLIKYFKSIRKPNIEVK